MFVFQKEQYKAHDYSTYQGKTMQVRHTTPVIVDGPRQEVVVKQYRLCNKAIANRKKAAALDPYSTSHGSPIVAVLTQGRALAHCKRQWPPKRIVVEVNFFQMMETIEDWRNFSVEPVHLGFKDFCKPNHHQHNECV